MVYKSTAENLERDTQERIQTPTLFDEQVKTTIIYILFSELKSSE